MKMLQMMKAASVAAYDATKPMMAQFGTVTGTSPLEVNVDQRFTLGEAFLIVPEHLTEYKLTIGETEYEIRKGLQAGDIVLLLRVQGGQQYIILDRVVVG
jgi:hypothetical protein